MTVERIFLVGFMGSGKSTVGRILARAMAWKFIDLDDYVQEKEGMTITQIFAQYGEKAFREMEKNAITEVSLLQNVIIATGGGAPCFHNNMVFMKEHGLTIYLFLNAEGLCERLMPARNSRPLIANKNKSELLAFIKEKIAEREPYYSKAHITADATTVGTEPYVNIIRLYQSQQQQ